MPELPEIAKMARGINKFCEMKKFLRIVKQPISKNIEIVPPYQPFYIQARSRGKELALRFLPSRENLDDIPRRDGDNLIMNMGLNGCWKYNKAKVSDKELPKYTLLVFEAEDGTKMMHCDKLRFSKWNFQEGYGKDRGPDPVKEFPEFCQNIQSAFQKSVSVRSFQKQPIGTMMLNQKYFNGIGNYLRAEILWRANIHPMETMYNALLMTDRLPENTITHTVPVPDPKDFDFTQSIVLKLCRDFCQEMLDASFIGKRCELKVYSRKGSEQFKDKNNRTVWFRSTQQFVVHPPLLLPEGQTTPPSPAPRKRRRSSTETADASTENASTPKPRRVRRATRKVSKEDEDDTPPRKKRRSSASEENSETIDLSTLSDSE